MCALFPVTGQADVTSSSWLINIFQYSFIYSSNPYFEVGMRGFQADMPECKPEELSSSSGFYFVLL